MEKLTFRKKIGASLFHRSYKAEPWGTCIATMYARVSKEQRNFDVQTCLFNKVSGAWGEVGTSF